MIPLLNYQSINGRKKRQQIIKFNTMSKIFSLMLVVLVSGCAATPGLVRKQPIVRPEVAKDKALVYFFRDGRFVGSGLGALVYDNNSEIGGLDYDSYFFHYSDPGKHTFAVVSTSRGKTKFKHPYAVFEADLSAGETYYFQFNFSMGIWGPIGDLLTRAPGAAIPKLKILEYKVLKKSQ